VVGLPNSGKSKLYNILTGDYNLVANYPLTTLEIKRTRRTVADREVEIIDTPGLHSLYIQSEEEIAVRNMLYRDTPDLVVQSIDAERLKQSLRLTADLLELGAPTIVVLTAVREGRRMGVNIEAQQLSELLGLPVLVSDGRRFRSDIRRAILKGGGTGNAVTYQDAVEEGIREVEALLPKDLPHRRKTALLLLESDPYILDTLADELPESVRQALPAAVRSADRRLGGSVKRMLRQQRMRWLVSVANRVITERTSAAADAANAETSDEVPSAASGGARSTGAGAGGLERPRRAPRGLSRQSRAAPGRFAQIFGHLSRHPVFGLPILAFFLLLTYFLVVDVAGFLEGFLNGSVVDPAVAFLAARIPDGFWEDFLVGHYGLLTLGLFNAICTVLPILSVFFIMFGLLEDIGYLPNLTILTKRIFEKIGLTGNAIIPLVLGFGCKTMATLTTKTLRSRKEKLIAIYLIAFAIPCSAQLGLDMAILGRVGLRVFPIYIVTLVVVEAAAGLILNRILPEDQPSAFIQELPPVRLPDPKAVLTKTGYRLYWFLKEAIPIFLIAAVLLFLADRFWVLDFLKRVLRPIVSGWLGLPVDIVDALILTMARHEAAAGLLLRMQDQGMLTAIQSVVAVVITTMFIPCIANIVAILKEAGIKAGVIITVSINVSSFILAGILRWILVLLTGGRGL